MGLKLHLLPWNQSSCFLNNTAQFSIVFRTCNDCRPTFPEVTACRRSIITSMSKNLRTYWRLTIIRVSLTIQVRTVDQLDTSGRWQFAVPRVVIRLDQLGSCVSVPLKISGSPLPPLLAATHHTSTVPLIRPSKKELPCQLQNFNKTRWNLSVYWASKRVSDFRWISWASRGWSIRNLDPTLHGQVFLVFVYKSRKKLQCFHDVRLCPHVEVIHNPNLKMFAAKKPCWSIKFYPSEKQQLAVPFSTFLHHATSLVPEMYPYVLVYCTAVTHTHMNTTLGFTKWF